MRRSGCECSHHKGSPAGSRVRSRHSQRTRRKTCRRHTSTHVCMVQIGRFEGRKRVLGRFGRDGDRSASGERAGMASAPVNLNVRVVAGSKMLDAEGLARWIGRARRVSCARRCKPQRTSTSRAVGGAVSVETAGDERARGGLGSGVARVRAR